MNKNLQRLGEQNGSAKLTKKQATAIRRIYATYGTIPGWKKREPHEITISGLARAFNLPRQTVADIAKGKTWVK